MMLEPTPESDAEALHRLGYAQELARRMSGLSNFALTFSVIGLLLGLTANFQAGFSVVGGFAVGVNWVISGLFAVIVAAALGQIASAYPTAGGLYHWSSILGGRGWGWATAWLNLISYVFSLASVNVAFYILFNSIVLTGFYGVNTSAWGLAHQIPAVIAITATQALLNTFGVQLLARLSDLGAWLNLLGCVLLLVLLLVGIRHFDLPALFTFHELQRRRWRGRGAAQREPGAAVRTRDDLSALDHDELRRRGARFRGDRGRPT